MLRIGYCLLILQLSKIGDSSSCETYEMCFVQGYMKPCYFMSQCVSVSVNILCALGKIMHCSCWIQCFAYLQYRGLNSASHMLGKPPLHIHFHPTYLWGRVFLCYPVWLGAHYIGQADLLLAILLPILYNNYILHDPALFRVLGLPVCTKM